MDQNAEMSRLKAPHEFDVIKGRGNGANLHPGNVSFRRLVNSHKDAYYVSSNDEKKRIVMRIIQLIQASDPPGRFLSEDRGIWTLMDQKSVFRKVGQALREHQVRPPKDVNEQKKEANEATKDTNDKKGTIDANEPRKDANERIEKKLDGDKPPKVINVAAPDGHTEGINQNGKRRIQERDNFFCNIRHANKLPRIGQRDIHKSLTQQYQISVVKEEVQMLRNQLSLLTKRVALLERQSDNSDAVNSFGLRGQQPTPTRVLQSDKTKPNSIFPSNLPGPSYMTKQSFRTKPSLRRFSQALASSIRGISQFDNVEDALFTILTSPDQEGRSKI